MKGVTIFLVLCGIAGAAVADPVSFHPGTGTPNVVQGGTDVCWSEPADLNGLIASSEQILQIGLETEVANDFVPTASCVFHVTWWGSFYNNVTPCAPDITTPGFNLKFYEDAGCMPTETPYVWISLTPDQFSEESVGCRSGVYPIFKWDADVHASTVGGDLYWFSAQMKDHAFPPQTGRLAAATVTGCDTVIRSAYFGFPAWTPVINVFGVAFDCSQEFMCTTEPCGPSPTKSTTWGVIKEGYLGRRPRSFRM
jgi:hypothetical protein